MEVTKNFSKESFLSIPKKVTSRTARYLEEMTHLETFHPSKTTTQQRKNDHLGISGEILCDMSYLIDVKGHSLKTPMICEALLEHETLSPEG